MDKVEVPQAKEYHIEDFNKKFFVNNSDHDIVSRNIWSINKNLDDFIINIAEFGFDIDVIILTECRINSNKPIPRLDNYYHYLSTNHVNHMHVIHTNLLLKKLI